MFDQHIICREGFGNVTRDGEVIGVRFWPVCLTTAVWVCRWWKISP